MPTFTVLFGFALSIVLFYSSGVIAKPEPAAAESICRSGESALKTFMTKWSASTEAGFWPALEKHLETNRICGDGAYGEDDTLPKAMISKWSQIHELAKTSTVFRQRLIGRINSTLGNEPRDLYELAKSSCTKELKDWCRRLMIRCKEVAAEAGCPILDEFKCQSGEKPSKTWKSNGRVFMVCGSLVPPKVDPRFENDVKQAGYMTLQGTIEVIRECYPKSRAILFDRPTGVEPEELVRINSRKELESIDTVGCTKLPTFNRTYKCNVKECELSSPTCSPYQLPRNPFPSIVKEFESLSTKDRSATDQDQYSIRGMPGCDFCRMHDQALSGDEKAFRILEESFGPTCHYENGDDIGNAFSRVQLARQLGCNGFKPHPTPTPVPTPRPVHNPDLVTKFGLKARASSTLPSQENIAYDVRNVFDGDPKTAWCADRKKNGIGEWIEISSDQSGWGGALELAIIPGYAKNSNMFLSNNQVTTVEIQNCKGKSVEETKFEFEPSNSSMNPGWIRVRTPQSNEDFTSPVFLGSGGTEANIRLRQERCVRIAIKAVKKGPLGDTCISEIELPNGMSCWKDCPKEK